MEPVEGRFQAIQDLLKVLDVAVALQVEFLACPFDATLDDRFRMCLIDVDADPQLGDPESHLPPSTTCEGPGRLELWRVDVLRVDVFHRAEDHLQQLIREGHCEGTCRCAEQSLL